MLDFLTLDDVDLAGKTVLLRVDINVPVDRQTLRISQSERLQAAAASLAEIAQSDAKVVTLAHQGRAGDYDFLPLDQHAAVLRGTLGSKFSFLDDTIGVAARERIKALKPQEMLLLQNVRFLAEETLERTPEEHSKSILVQRLSALADVFVNDAFSAAHRSQASLVGFTCTLPSVAGRTMEKELRFDKQAFDNPKRPVVYFFGGSKPDDLVEAMQYALNKGTVDCVLTAGVLSQVCLLAQGVHIGDDTTNFLKGRGYLNCLEDVKRLLGQFSEHIRVPVDVAYKRNDKREERDLNHPSDNGVIVDIGGKTIDAYRSIINGAGTIVAKGPAGMYENRNYARGTKAVLEAIGSSHAFSLIGGGHTLSAVRELGIDETEFSYVSLGGGAFIDYLSGKKLPAYEALKQAEARYRASR
ncbi:MAG: phosphoglycerate kinase [Halobacteriota archaeon]